MAGSNGCAVYAVAAASIAGVVWLWYWLLSQPMPLWFKVVAVLILLVALGDALLDIAQSRKR